MDRNEAATVRTQTVWDQGAIVAALQRRREGGLELNARAIQKSDHRLAHAILWHFESHDAALRAAGFDPALVRQRISWDTDRIISLLRQRHSRGMEVTGTAVANCDPTLSGAIRRHFPSHADALRAAGIDPGAARKRLSWDKTKIVAALRDRVSRGLDVSFGAVTASDVRLRGAINTHFGSHDEALRAAGNNSSGLM